MVHETLEKYLKNDLCQFEMPDYFLDKFDSEVPNGVKLKLPTGFNLDLTKNYKTQITDFLNDFSGFVIDGKKIGIVDIEKNFLLVIQINDKEIILNGIIDVVGKDDEGNYYILDHKSKKEFKNEDEKRDYARQLYIYSLYIKYHYGKYPVKLVFNMFRTQKLEIVNFSEEDFNESLQWVEQSINKIENEELFLPIDFNQDLKDFEQAQQNVDNLKYSYDASQETKNTKSKYKIIHDSLKDKMFFCGNLCGHSEMCPNWQHTLNSYKEILSGGDKN